MKAAHILPLLALALLSCESMLPMRARARLTQPLLVPVRVDGHENYQNTREWPVTVNGTTHRIPKGLIVDGASVPRMCWSFMPPDGLHRAGAFFHDWGYINKGILPDGPILTRHQCDEAFYNLMVEAGVSEKRAGLAYRGVRIGGWKVWNRPRQPLLILPVDERMAVRDARERTFSRHIYSSP